MDDSMFENKCFDEMIIEILNDETKSIGWEKTSETLKMTVSQLHHLLRRRDASFELKLEMVRATRSPTLLREILNRLGLGLSESRQQNHQASIRRH
jgi:hypothetical protein